MTKPGAAFSLRLDFGLGEAPAPIRVRVSSGIALRMEGRIDVDAEVPGRGGSTVPG